ncbi:hypothetical protein QO259_05685 [Salinicola sp. JS01]|uniref:hypothetical protein n=1 Tax=Salinicola sp. JS01 TaxID=3050071 RepID=UPI00255BCC1B|nr:hypothetical protein [Salinicola sp. JS01]WIX34154.1 hypothetical protein QO259_05685 [Salinicola sp. JS01]
MRLILDNLHDRATLTATSAAAECGIDTTQRDEREYRWRSADTGEQVITATFDRTRYLDTVVLAQHNLSGAADLVLELLDSDGNTLWSSGSVITADYIPAGVWRAGIDPWMATYNDQLAQPLTIIDTPLTAARGYRLTINDPANASGALEIWRIAAGQWFSTVYGPSWGIDLNWRDNGKRTRTYGGSLRTRGGGFVWRELALRLDHLTPSDMTRLTVDLAQRGSVATVFLDCLPQRGSIDRLRAAFFAQLDGGYGDTHDRYRNYAAPLKFLEV